MVDKNDGFGIPEQKAADPRAELLRAMIVSCVCKAACPRRSPSYIKMKGEGVFLVPTQPHGEMTVSQGNHGEMVSQTQC